MLRSKACSRQNTQAKKNGTSTKKKQSNRANILDYHLDEQIAKHTTAVARALGEDFLARQFELSLAAAAHVQDKVRHHREVVGVPAPHKHQVRHAHDTQKPAPTDEL